MSSSSFSPNRTSKEKSSHSWFQVMNRTWDIAFGQKKLTCTVDLKGLCFQRNSMVGGHLSKCKWNLLVVIDAFRSFVFKFGSPVFDWTIINFHFPQFSPPFLTGAYMIPFQSERRFLDVPYIITRTLCNITRGDNIWRYISTNANKLWNENMKNEFVHGIHNRKITSYPTLIDW